jgi:hypothetical protein
MELTSAANATLDVRHAKVGHLGDLAQWSSYLAIEGFTYTSIESANRFEEWFRKARHYAPQPYEQLASVVANQGNKTLATKIRYSGRERERSESPWPEWLWLTVLKSLIGYGYYPQLAILWAGSLVIVGAAALRLSGEGPRNGLPFGIAYSFDMLLPIIKLRDWHYKIDVKGWARYYFYWHKIRGFVLTSFLIAALSGLTT